MHPKTIALPHPIDIPATLSAIEKRKCELSLVEFIKAAWHVIEPGQPYVHNWHVDFIAAHLTAITDGIQFDDGTYYNRLLTNIPPGTSKSVIVNIFWPAWEWGPRNMPHLRYVCAAHAQHLALRDSIRMRRLVSSEWYQSHWGDRVKLVRDQNQVSKFENTATGFRQASAAGSITGARGDRVILDDPLSVEDGMSATVLESTKNWFLEAVPTRLNNPDKSAIVVIMQRLHECLLPGTLVRTPDGEAAIETLRVGDTVYGSNGWQQIEWAGSREYSGLAYGVRSYGHLTTCWTTDNHLYFTERGWVRADELKKSDWVRLPIPDSGLTDVPWDEPMRSEVPGVTGTFTDGRHSVSCGTFYEVRLDWKGPASARNKSKIENGAMWHRISKIETKPYDGLVYDITTPSHDFVVGNATVHNSDTSGVILDMDLGYDHVMLPMRYEAARAYPTKLGYEDPRTEEGELLFPERFPEHVVSQLEASLGQYGTAGQLQQIPVPRGGGIIKPSWWKLWEEKHYPQMDYVILSLDTAYTEKQENDPSGFIIWGVFSQRTDTSATRIVDRYGRQIEDGGSKYGVELGPTPKVMMMYAWTDHLEFHELVQHVAKTATKYAVDEILIENKAAGHSVAQELRRLFSNDDFSVRMYDPKTLDKSARLYSVQHIFEEGMVYAPDKDWAEAAIRQIASFPKGKHDEFADCASSGIKSLRDRGFLTRSAERMKRIEDGSRFTGNKSAPLYVT